MQLLQTLLDLIYPPRCAGCGTRGVRLCAACLATCIPLEPQRRPRPLSAASPLQRVMGIYPFDGVVREAIHVFKYNKDRGLARPLALLLTDFCPLKADALVPVPLHGERLRERGFNQSSLLAQELSKLWQIPVNEQLQRTRATDHQVGQNRTARAENVAGAFAWRGAPPPKTVLLIDDVLTTGATLESCATALLAAGATTIEGITIAKAGK